MILSYNFSLTGREHKNMGLPCHDYSETSEISPSWKIAVVADGVGSCKHAEIASKIAVETVIELIKKQFPPFIGDKEIYKSVILSAMHGAANAIESYVETNDPENEMEYQTTLALAIMSKQCLFYGNAGDSGIIALDEQGKYHVMSNKQKDKNGGVYSLPMYRRFEVGVADFVPVAVICSTDGIFDYLTPKELVGNECKVYVPFSNLFVTYGLDIDEKENENETEKCKTRIIEYLSSDVCSMMRDDLSVAVLVITDSYLQPEDIVWEKPEIDYYSILWEEASIYPSEKTRICYFTDAVKEIEPSLSDEKISELIEKYIRNENKDKDNEKSPLKNSYIVDELVNDEKYITLQNALAETEKNDQTIIKESRGLKTGFFTKKKDRR